MLGVAPNENNATKISNLDLSVSFNSKRVHGVPPYEILDILFVKLKP